MVALWLLIETHAIRHIQSVLIGLVMVKHQAIDLGKVLDIARA
jgi:hypothetical protein